MLLKKIIIENYGLYAGKIEFDLTPRTKQGQSKPIILLGGKNGSGKTTLLEALRLTLYGKSILGNKVSKIDYEKFLRRQIHNSANTVLPATFSRVAVEFDHVSMGERTNYFVERSWSLENDTIKEILKIFTNGNPEQNVSNDFWRGFIEEIIPERISQLFFFDGEKIKSIAEDNGENQILAQSIKTLLGLDIVERLKADLSIYKTRELKQASTINDKKAWDNIEKKNSILKDEIALDLEELPHIRTQIAGNHAEIKECEVRLSNEGNLFASNRESLKTENRHLNSRIETLENLIREECTSNFPFSLCPSITQLLKEQLKSESKLKRHSILKDEILALEKEILTGLRSLEKTDSLTQKKIEKIIHMSVKNKVEITSEIKGLKEIFGFSDSVSEQITTELTDGEIRSKNLIKTLAQELNEKLVKLRKTTQEIEKSPDEIQIQPIFEELTVLNQRRAKLQHKEKKLQEAIGKKEHALKISQRELLKLIDQQKAGKTTQEQLGMVKNIQTVLDKYLKKLTLKKIEQLRQTVAEEFNNLSRKGNIIKYIDINPDNFSVTLFDQNEKKIPKDSLSSGEKQLYAVAMLWGLAKTSGRPLPIIIDTPLGRLDSEHRQNLIHNYFPKASHQVIILSTDTEVDQQLYKELKPHLSHCYHLNYNLESKCTTPSERYFWKEAH